MSKYYAVLTTPGTGPSAEIQDYMFDVFKGKTALAAINRARESLLASTEGSRGEYEEEHGKVSDEEFLRVLAKGGFIIKSATFGKD
jgi:hypothetical protein